MNALGRRTRGIAKEFREFISRGNVIDMAVGVVVGGAFTQIVNSLVTGILTPIIGLLVGGMDLSGFKLVIRPATDAASEVAINYGALIQQVLSFIIIAACVFALVKALGVVARGGGMLAGVRGQVGGGAGGGSAGVAGDVPRSAGVAAGNDAAAAAESDSLEPQAPDAETAQLLREIRDLLRAMADARDDGHMASALPVARGEGQSSALPYEQDAAPSSKTAKDIYNP